MRNLFDRAGLHAMLACCLAFVASGQSNSVENQAKAILDTNCLACHGQARMSDLDLRETSSILKGGKRGPAVVPGNA
ncbi:MAG: hypothetical protein JJE04_11965, partial [Acidobacteriia bacterium]|nr:hypothetical protein [Terriglobia bacterium]